jgi:hypothetical protein
LADFVSDDLRGGQATLFRKAQGEDAVAIEDAIALGVLAFLVAMVFAIHLNRHAHRRAVEVSDPTQDGGLSPEAPAIQRLASQQAP